MADQINTDLNLELKDEDILSKVARLAAQMQQIAEGAKTFSEKMVIPPETLAFLQLAAKGQTLSVANLAAGSAAKADLRGTTTAVGADVLKTQLSVNQQIAKVGEQLNAELQLQQKLQQGIIDLETLSYKQKLANYEIGKLLAVQPEVQGRTLEQVNAELARQQNILRIINLEMEEINAAAAEQTLRQKQIAEAEVRSQAIVAAAQAQRNAQIEAAHQKQAQENIGFAALEAQAIKQQTDEAEGERRAQILQTQRVQKQALQDQKAAAQREREEEAAAAKKAKEEAAATTPQALSRAGAQAFEQADALRKIKQGIVDLDTIAYQREAAQVEIGRLLRTEALGVASAQAQVTLQLEKQYATLRSLDTAQKDYQAHSRINNILQTGGADLLKVQAQLLVNYGLINAVLGSIRFGATFLKDLDEEFHQLQAIGALTDTEMVNLKKDILEIGQSSKFSAVEISKVAVTLAQAGLSGNQIKESLKGIVNLATASGSSLADAAQNVTTVLNVFDYQANQTADIANIMTAALNQSKLTMQQLTQGISYAANTAANAGVSFTELVATFGVLADAGIKSGSTIGTGYRKLITDLENPTAKFKEKVVELGLSMQDVDIQTHGVTEVLNTLRNAGFTAADAMSSLDIRASAVAIPLLKSADAIGIFEQRLYLSQAAVEASDKQMESLTNSANKLQNAFGSLIYDTFGGWVTATAKFASATADVINSLGPLKGTVEALIEVMAVLVGGAIIAQLTKLVVGLSGLSTIFTGLVGAASGIRALFTALATGLEVTTAGLTATVIGAEGLAVATVGLGPIIGAIVVALGFLATALFNGKTKLQGLNAEADVAQAKLAGLQGEMEKTSGKTKQLEDYMADLIKKNGEYSTNQEALNAKILEGAAAFNGMGSEVIRVGDNIAELTRKIQILEKENITKAIDQGKAYLAQQANASAVTNKQIEEQVITQPGEVQKLFNKLFVTDSIEKQRPLTAGPGDPGLVDLSKRVQEALANKSTKLEDLIALQTETTEKQTSLINVNDHKQADILDGVIQAIKDRKNLLGKQGVAEIDTKQAEMMEQGLEYQKQNGDDIRALIAKTEEVKTTANTQFTTGKTAEGDKADRAKTIEALKDVSTQLEADIQRRTKESPAFANSPIFKVESAQLAAINADITTKTGQLDSTLDKIDKLDDQLLKQKIQTLESEIKVSSLAKARALADQVLEDAAKIRDTKRAEAQRYVDSNKFKLDQANAGIAPNSAAYAEIRQKTLQTMLGEANEGYKTIRQQVENSILQKEAKRDTIQTKQIIDPLDTLRNSITAATQAYKAQIEALNAHTEMLKAERESSDLRKNSPYVSDATRHQQDDALEKDAEEKALATAKAAQELYETQLANKQAAEKIAQVSYDDAVAAQKRLEAAAGSPHASVEGSIFAQNKEDTKKANKDVLAAGQQAIYAKKAWDEAAAAARKYQIEVEKNESIQKTFTDTFNDYVRSSVYGTQRIGQDFSSMFGDVRSGTQDLIRNFINGNATIAQSFKALSLKIIQDLEDIAIKKATQGIFDSILGSFGGGIGSLFGGGSSSGSFGNIGNASTISGGDFSISGTTLTGATGGLITGGVPGRDSVPILTMPDEFLLNASATKSIGIDTLHKINNGNLSLSKSLDTSVAATNDNSQKTMNVYVVSPDQQPSLGPNDVVAVIGDNISRGGSIKQLIKSISL